MLNPKNAKRSLNEAWGTGNAQNQYFASHTSDWGRQSNNQYSLLATNEGFEESFPSLPSSRSEGRNIQLRSNNTIIAGQIKKESKQ